MYEQDLTLWNKLNFIEVDVWAKTELNSVFEFQSKFPFWEPVSCQRLAWL